MSDEQLTNPVERGPLQFSTRTLLGGTAACALLVLMVQAVGAVWGMVILWFLLLIAAHVAGNLHGSHQSARASHEASMSAAAIASQSAAAGIVAGCAPATRLRDNKGFGRTRTILTTSTAALGCVIGTAALLLGTRVGAGGVVLGGLSTGILGGFLGFLCGSFLMVATGAFREAVDEQYVLPLGRTKRAA